MSLVCPISYPRTCGSTKDFIYLFIYFVGAPLIKEEEYYDVIFISGLLF
jgi:hypothetical protein